MYPPASDLTPFSLLALATLSTGEPVAPDGRWLYTPGKAVPFEDILEAVCYIWPGDGPQDDTFRLRVFFSLRNVCENYQRDGIGLVRQDGRGLYRLTAEGRYATAKVVEALHNPPPCLSAKKARKPIPRRPLPRPRKRGPNGHLYDVGMR